MRKIQTIFVRNPEDRKHVLGEVTGGMRVNQLGERVAEAMAVYGYPKDGNS